MLNILIALYILGLASAAFGKHSIGADGKYTDKFEVHENEKHCYVFTGTVKKGDEALKPEKLEVWSDGVMIAAAPRNMVRSLICKPMELEIIVELKEGTGPGTIDTSLLEYIY